MNSQPEQINNRIQALRDAMKRNQIAAYIVSGGDAHLSEYAADRWTGRRYLTGFTGSAGTVVVTHKKAGLWTDSRYFLQGASQLEGTVVELYKEETEGVPTIKEFLSAELAAGETVGWDSACFSVKQSEELSQYLHNFELKTTTVDLLDEIWQDRPEVPKGKLFLHPIEYAGEQTADRIGRIRMAVKKEGADTLLITMLDELCWAFNIRGGDVAFNPVGVGYGYISQERAILFVYPEKVSQELQAQLSGQGVELCNYEEFVSFLTNEPNHGKVLIDKDRTAQLLYHTLKQRGTTEFVFATSPINPMKSVKNSAEVAGVKRAMVRDGVALTRFFIWLEQALQSGEEVTEYSAGRKLTEFRAKQPLYVGDSFDTICGYKGNGAIVHYRAPEEGSNKLEPHGILLLDSGGQYLDGTTDITRTFALGDVTDRQRTDYTLVLKGHISLALALFPQGTRGNQLDILARKALWDRGLSYGHGTGHGVGVFLNVHEGPQNFRTDNNPSPMLLGTITSNEPGLYRTGEYGIRIENLVLTVEKMQTEFGTFYGFETLTRCYLDNTLVDTSLLSSQEIEWYNQYQEEVYKALAPELSEEERTWLANKTQPLA